MHKAADQINSLSYNMNLLAQTPFKAEPKIKRTPEIHLTNLQNETNLHNTDSEQLTYHSFPRHCARFTREALLRLQTFSSACSGPADRALVAALCTSFAFLPVAQHIPLSCADTVCRAAFTI